MNADGLLISAIILLIFLAPTERICLNTNYQPGWALSALLLALGFYFCLIGYCVASSNWLLLTLILVQSVVVFVRQRHSRRLAALRVDSDQRA